MTQAELFYRFGVALAIGLLIGLQREHAHDKSDGETEIFAGVRTFPLLALFGCSAAFIAQEAGSIWLLTTSLILVGGLIVAVYVVTAWRGDVGMTSEVAALLTVMVGALCFYGRVAEAAALGVTIMALLALRIELHRFAGKITRADMLATVKFGVITAVILPVVPNESFGDAPFDVLNPRKIWLMVVLISGMSFIGYVLIKTIGAKRGIGLTGLLGGMASSTAVTLAFSQRSRGRGALGRLFAVAITIAWTTMFARVIVEVAVVNRALLELVWIPMAAGGAVGLAYAAKLQFGKSASDDEEIEFSNPFELGPALRFGALYALILLVSRFAQTEFGTEGVYVSSVLAGLTDVDAITLSMAELSRTGEVDGFVASRAITLAAVSNTVVKGGLVLGTGSSELKRVMVPGFVLMVGAALAAAFLA